MATPHVGPLPAGTKQCAVCFEPINAKAWKCIHCQSDQLGWRRRIGISATMMSLLVALVAVLAAAVPAWRSVITPENSNLRFSPQGATAETVSILVSNNGIRPGSVRAGSLTIGNSPMTLHIHAMAKNEPRIVEPGKSELIKFYSESQFVGDSSGACEFLIISMDFRGERRNNVFPVDCREVLPFVSAHRENAPR